MGVRNFNRHLFLRITAVTVLLSFIFTSVPVRSFASSGNDKDELRARSTFVAGRDGGRAEILKDLGADIFALQKQTFASLAEKERVQVYGYDSKRAGYRVTWLNKKELGKLLLRDQAGLIEDEDNPGQYIWARKTDGAPVTKNGDLVISGRVTYPTNEDVPYDNTVLNRYAKVVPLAYNFFRLYSLNGEFNWISEVMENAKILLTTPGSLGERHFSVDKASKTIKIEKEFLDYLMQGGQKRVGMGLFADAAIQLSDKNITQEEAKKIMDRIAQVSLTGKNRLEDAIYLFNLIKEINRLSRTKDARALTPAERQYFLIDVMERNRGVDGRKAAELLRKAEIGDGKKLGHYAKVTAKDAEADLEAIAEDYPAIVIKEIDSKDKKKAPIFRLNGDHLADKSLIEGRNIVPDFIVSDRDTSLFGGKTAYTGMMQWLPGAITMQMFATAGRCFMDLVEYNNLKESFTEYDKVLVNTLADLEKGYNDDIKYLQGNQPAFDERRSRYVKEKKELVVKVAAKFQDSLEWGNAKIPPQLAQEIRENLDVLAKSLGVPIYQLMLAIRSSAVGEDSETASFAGRQDTSLFVSYLKELFKTLDTNPERFGYTWEQLAQEVFPWYDILNKLRQEVGEIELNDAMYDIFIKEWLANQRSLFNERSIEYRLEMKIPIFTDKAAMSSLFQQMALTEYGFVAFSVNRASGYPEIEGEIIEGQTNPLVSGDGTGDLFYVELQGGKPYRRYKPPEDGRSTWHVPGIIFDQATLKEKLKSGKMDKGGVFVLPFPDKLKGSPAVSDRILLANIGRALTELSNAFGSFSDMEGGLIVRRDKHGNVIYVEDSSEPDGIAKDHLGRPRTQMIQFMTQIRPETKYNFMDPDIIELNYKQVTEASIKKARELGKVLYENPQAHTQGAVKGKVYVVDKEHPETWNKTVGKIMATMQSDPDMNEIMKEALAVIAAVGGRNSHTMIVATEYGLIAISGIGNLDKLWDGRKVTVDAEAGLILDGWDYDLVDAGRSYNVKDLGVLPADFYVGLNINSTQLAHKARAFRNKPDFYRVGLGRLELFLADLIGAAGEGLLRYDAYKIYSLIEKLDKGQANLAEKMLLNKMLKYKGDTEHLRPNVNVKDNTISVVDKGKKLVYKTGLEFYRAYIEDKQNPKYDPGNPADLKLIKTFDEMTKGYLLGEERYVNLMSGGIKSVVNSLIVEPLEILELAQSVNNLELRNSLLDIAQAYKQTFDETEGALSTNELLKQTEELIKSYKRKASKEDLKVVDMMRRHFYGVFLFRLDDLKDDEYNKIPGSAKQTSRNSMAGYRGIDSFVDNPKVTRMQLKAIKKVVDLGARRDENGNSYGPGKFRIGIFAPMVYDAEHVKEMNKISDEAGLTSDRLLRGSMIETPQAVEIWDILESGIDFGSVGSNDLTQFTFEIDRQNSAVYFNSVSERSIQSIRALISLVNTIKRYNKVVREPQGLKPITIGFCGNWPAVDPAGAIVLYLLGYDSASITIPSIDRTTNDMYTLLDHILGHDEKGLLNEPENKEALVKSLYELISNKDKQNGLPKNLVEMLSFLKTVLDNRDFEIYKQINPDAKPDIKEAFAKGSISAFHLQLPFHYQLLAEYDKKEKGKLFVKESEAELFNEIARLKTVKKQYEAEFTLLKKQSGMDGEEIEKKLDAMAAKIQGVNQGIKDAEYKLTSIALKKVVEEYLDLSGADINIANIGKKFYMNSLKTYWRQQALEARERGEPFIIETSKEPADYLKLKLGGERYELPKEPNPDLGNRGMKKVLNPDRNIFLWELEAINEFRHEGHDNIMLALSKVREPSEIDDARLLMKELGLANIPLGMVVNSPNNIFAYDFYLAKERGISFMLLDREAMRELAEAKRGTEWDNVNTELINDADVDKSLARVTIPVTKTAAANYGVTLYLAENPKNELPDVYAFNKVFQADSRTHNKYATGFSDFLGPVKDLKDNDEAGKGALVVKAEVILKNAGSIAVFKELKGANPEFRVAVWAKNAAEFNKVMRLSGVADIVSIGLDSALEKLNSGYHIGFDRIMIISSKVEPQDEVSKALSNKKGLRVVSVDAPRVTEDAVKSGQVKENAMAVVVAKATASIFQNEPAVVEKYKEFIEQQSAQIANKEDYDKLLDLTGQMSEIPLIQVAAAKSQEAAQLQITYEETLGKI